MAWSVRLGYPRANQFTLVAELDEELVGFVHVILEDDPTWGVLVDNLHVANGYARRGIGTRLMVLAAAELTRRGAHGFYLWVLAHNEAAQAFYRALGGRHVETILQGPLPGGGNTLSCRFAWPDSAVLLSASP